MSSLRQNSARGGRGFNCGFGLRTGGLGGLRAGAAAVSAAPAPAGDGVGIAGVATAFDVGDDGALLDDASVDILLQLRAFLSITATHTSSLHKLQCCNEDDTNCGLQRIEK